MKEISQLQKVKGDAYDYYVSPAENDLFEKIFLVGDIVKEIESLDKYFLIGEKGSGKTAYAVYMSKMETANSSCQLTLVENTLYQRFLRMREKKSLELSSVKDIWINLLYLLLAEHIQKQYTKPIWNQLKYKQLINAINAFYSNSFKPELVNAMEFLDKASMSINEMIKHGVYSAGGKLSKEKYKKYEEKSYQVSLMKIRDGFEQAFEKISLDKELILFVDGIDGRPADIDSKQYFECLTGLVNAVIEINQNVLCKKNMKVMLLMRPDIMYKMPVHNLNQKLRENSILLDWVTTYRNYVKSKLFKIADDYFQKQQEKSYELAECWNYYFPYKVTYRTSDRKDNTFVEFLRYSLYKPRDILTMLNELVDATKERQHFTHGDFKTMLGRYSVYLKGELKDYMLIYMTDIDYANFLVFFDYFVGHRDFDYDFFVQQHKEYVKYLNEIGRDVPPNMATAGEALQLLYDANIICYKVENRPHRPKMFWSYKERSYANMQPEVYKFGYYVFYI